MAAHVKRPQPTTVTLVVLIALILSLGLWLVVEVSDAPVSEDGSPGPLAPTYLVADEEEPPPPLPTLLPPPLPLAEKTTGTAPPPPELVPGEPTPPEEEDIEVLPEPEAPIVEKERSLLPDHRGRWGRDWRSGAVGRTDATATREVVAEEGTAWIGSPARWVDGLIGQRGAGAYPGLIFEVPRHPRRMRPYFIDRFEVKNHDYLRYLQTTSAVTYNTSNHDPRNLVEIAQVLILDPPVNLDYAHGVARQLFQANRLTLLQVFKSAIVEREGVVDDTRTFLNLIERIVPRDVRLQFYDKAPPGTWPSMTYASGRGGFPVRDLSLEEAQGYAHWDGHHIPSEFEWEYAARGPRGLDYPWGAHADDLEVRANGGHVYAQGERPRTMPVFNYPDGISWIGCFNMLGNVSEWTRSFLSPYPGGAVLSPPGSRPVLVVRGGSAADEDPLLLRSAFRGWSDQDPQTFPRPGYRRLWTGFRTARYEAVGLSRTPEMHYLAILGGQIDPALLEPDIYEARQGLQVDHVQRQFGDHNTRPGVKSLVVQPLREVALRPAGEARHVANTDPAQRTLGALHALSQVQPVLVGMFQTDLHLTSTWHEPSSGAAALRRALCPPGSWYVGLYKSRLALLRPDFSDVFFIGNREAPKALFNVREVRASRREGPAVPQASLRYTGGTVQANVKLQVQVHREDARVFLVNLDMRVDVDAREAVAVRNWESGAEHEPRAEPR